MKEMTSRERLLAAYRHEPVDRVPVCPRLGAWLKWKDPNAGLAEHLALQQRYVLDPEVVASPFSHVVGLGRSLGPVMPEVRADVEEARDGRLTMVRRTFRTPAGDLTDLTRFPPPGDLTYGVSPNPSRVEFLVKGPDDVEALRYLMPPPTTAANFDVCRRTEEAVGERGLVLVQIFSPLCHRAGDACSMEDLMVWYHTDRDLFDTVFNLFRDEMLEEVRLSLAAGYRHFFGNYYYDSLSAGWSPQIWQEVFQPAVRAFCDMVHAEGGLVNLYDDGKCSRILEAFADAGVDVLQTLTPPPVGDIDLADAKRRIGDRVCLMGYVDLLYVIKHGTPDLIDRTVREAIEIGAPGGGFILGTSDSIRDGTPDENVDAYFEAARRYGQL